MQARHIVSIHNGSAAAGKLRGLREKCGSQCSLFNYRWGLNRYRTEPGRCFCRDELVAQSRITH